MLAPASSDACFTSLPAVLLRSCLGLPSFLLRRAVLKADRPVSRTAGSATGGGARPACCPPRDVHPQRGPPRATRSQARHAQRRAPSSSDRWACVRLFPDASRYFAIPPNRAVCARNAVVRRSFVARMITIILRPGVDVE